MEDSISFNKPNDWEAEYSIPGFVLIFLGLIGLFQVWVWVAPFLIFGGLAFLNYGRRITLNFDTKELTFQDSVFGKALKFNIIRYDLSDFKNIEISQFSEAGGRSYGGVISSRYRYRTYPVNLIPNEKRSKILISEFNQYPQAKAFASKIAKKLNISLEDKLLDKMMENRRRRRK